MTNENEKLPFHSKTASNNRDDLNDEVTHELL